MLFHQKLCTHKGTSCIPFGIFIKFEKNVPQNAIPTTQHYIRTPCPIFDTYLSLPFHCIFNNLAMFMKKFIWGFYKLCRVNKHVATILKNFSTDYCYCIYFPSFMQIFLQLSNYQLLRKLFRQTYCQAAAVKAYLHTGWRNFGIGWKFVQNELNIFE